MAKVELDEKQIKELAELSKLSEEDVRRASKDIVRILEFVGKIAELNLDDVPPTSWTLGFSQRLRDDKPENFENVQKIVEGFPRSRGKFAVVPRVVKGK